MKKFENPSVEIEMMDLEDVLTTSQGNSGCDCDDDYEECRREIG